MKNSDSSIMFNERRVDAPLSITISQITRNNTQPTKTTDKHGCSKNTAVALLG